MQTITHPEQKAAYRSVSTDRHEGKRDLVALQLIFEKQHATTKTFPREDHM